MIPIRVESDVTRACELTNEVAATADFSLAEQTRLVESVSEVAKVLLESPLHGYFAVAILREDEVPGVAIAVRVVGEGHGEAPKSAPGHKRKGRPGKIDEIGGNFDRIEKSEAGGDLLVTLVQWRRDEQQSSASSRSNSLGK